MQGRLPALFLTQVNIFSSTPFNAYLMFGNFLFCGGKSAREAWVFSKFKWDRTPVIR